MAEPESVPSDPTYHIDIWAMPEPVYVCMLCLPRDAFRGDIPAVTQHLREAHDADAIPTTMIDSLLGLRREADERTAATAAAQTTAAAEATVAAEGTATAEATVAPSPTEENDHG